MDDLPPPPYKKRADLALLRGLERGDRDEDVNATFTPTTSAVCARHLLNIVSAIERIIKMLLRAIIGILSSIARNLERLLKEFLNDRYVASPPRLGPALEVCYD